MCPARRRRRKFRLFDLKPARSIKADPQAHGRFQIFSNSSQLGFERLTIKCKFELASASFEPIHVKAQERIWIGAKSKGLQQMEIRLRSNECRFLQAFIPLASSIAVEDNCRSHIVASALLARREDQGANCHVEFGISVLANMTDRSGVGSTPAGWGSFE